MKLWVGAGAATLVAVTAVVLMSSATDPDVQIGMGPAGLSSLKVAGTELLAGGDFKVEEVQLQKSGGERYAGSVNASTSVDASARTVRKTFRWGTITTHYAAAGNRLNVSIETENTSGSETIQGVRYYPLYLRFPARANEYDGTNPLLVHNVGQLAAVRVSYGSGSVGIVADDMDKPIMVGLPWALNRPSNTEFPVSVSTGRVASYPDSLPNIERPIGPNKKDVMNVSLRFGRTRADADHLYGDAYKRFADTFPMKLNWPDHRAIGAIFIATDARTSGNPRGWFGDQEINVKTPAGQATFRQRLMSMADASVQIMREMNAQGAITWDIEGQEFPRANYVGDPRQVDDMAPEMGRVVDDYFGKFRAAGLRYGVCVRPQRVRFDAGKNDAVQEATDDPAAILIEKIGYARKRWGATLFYIDSNINAKDPNPLDAGVIEKVAAAFPDVLLISEHATLRYYAYAIPFKELRQGAITTPKPVRSVYPTAASLIYTADGPLDLYRKDLTAAVRRGDILMYRTWFSDPQNLKVKALYNR